MCNSSLFSNRLGFYFHIHILLIFGTFDYVFEDVCSDALIELVRFIIHYLYK